jgi:NADP-dependent 3-hydroxy acid dehydrogenase YdfG
MKKAGAMEKQIVTVLGPIQEEKTVNELVQKTVAAFGKIDILVSINKQQKICNY